MLRKLYAAYDNLAAWLSSKKTKAFLTGLSTILAADTVTGLRMSETTSQAVAAPSGNELSSAPN